MRNEAKKMAATVNLELWEQFRLRAIRDGITVKKAIEQVISDFMSEPVTPGNKQPEGKTITINIPVEGPFHRMMKARAFKEKRTLKELLEIAITSAMEKYNF